MRVCLVHVPRPEYAGGQLQRTFINIMPVGLLGLADALDRDGHEVEVVHLGLASLRDPGFDLAAHLGGWGADLVGFSLHWHHQIAGVLQQARRVREALDQIPVVLGGLTATFFAEQLLARFSFFDMVVRGDGELALRRLAAGDAPATVPNLAHREQGAVTCNPLSYAASSAELSALDFSRLDLLRDADLYSARWFLHPDETPAAHNHNKIFYLCGGRGCTVSCSFCGGSRSAHRLLSGRRQIALRSPERLAEDALKVAAAGYGTLYLCFDPPGLPAEHYPRLFELVGRLDTGQSMIFECYGLPSEPFLDAFAAAFDLSGSQIALSPDSADEATRGRHKGYSYTNEALCGSLAACASRGIATTVYFTLFPGDGWPEVRRLRAFQEMLRQRFGSAVMTLPVEMEPAAPWQLSPGHHGLDAPSLPRFDLDYFIGRQRAISTPPGLDKPELAHLSPDVYEMLEFLEAGG